MAKKEMKFEEAMGALEQIVRQLESGNVPLDEALDKFKEGMELSQFCNETLTKAEETVRAMITANAEGKEAESYGEGCYSTTSTRRSTSLNAAD